MGFLYFGGLIEIVLGEAFFNLFIVPSLIGNIVGILFTISYDVYFSKVKIKPENIGLFLRLPTLILLLIAFIALILINIELTFSLFIIGFGLGNMTAIIAISSLIAYYHGYR